MLREFDHDHDDDVVAAYVPQASVVVPHCVVLCSATFSRGLPAAGHGLCKSLCQDRARELQMHKCTPSKFPMLGRIGVPQLESNHENFSHLQSDRFTPSLI